MHQNALFRMEKVKNFLQTPPPLGRGIRPPQTPPPRRLRRLDSRAPLTVLSAPLRDLGWRRPWLQPLMKDETSNKPTDQLSQE